MSTSGFSARNGIDFALPLLPYDEDALEPLISRRTLALHYGEHHRRYVEKLNGLVRHTELASVPLDEVVRRTAGMQAQQSIFDNAAQAWNHYFYWRSLTPRSGHPPMTLLSRINRDIGGYEALVEGFVSACVDQFGSGWAWLVLKHGKLAIVTTSNADTPIAKGLAPLLTVDVWEHAYYLDYRNQREVYARKVIENLLNWEFAGQNLQAVAA